MRDSNPKPTATWTETRAYVLAAICLACGIAFGYVLASPSFRAGPVAAAVQPQSARPPAAASVGQRKGDADKRIEPLLQQLQLRPDDAAVLTELGNAYFDSQQFRDAATYYERSEQVRPGNADVLTDLGTAYYRLGNVEKALLLYNEALRRDPAFANAWFNIGAVSWEAKKDAEGAVVAWRNLLQRNPNHPRRDEVQKLIFHVRTIGAKRAAGGP